jgi:hypothetical protein
MISRGYGKFYANTMRFYIRDLNKHILVPTKGEEDLWIPNVYA